MEAYKTGKLHEWELKVNDLSNDINTLEERLSNAYSNNIIPLKYRNLEAMTFIAAFMGSSQYDLKFAIERFDKDVDQVIARQNLTVNMAMAYTSMEILKEAQYSSYLSEQILDYNENMLTEMQSNSKTVKQIRNLTALNTAINVKEMLDRRKRMKSLKS